jgi:hypothetical protein
MPFAIARFRPSPVRVRSRGSGRSSGTGFGHLGAETGSPAVRRDESAGGDVGAGASQME